MSGEKEIEIVTNISCFACWKAKICLNFSMKLTMLTNLSLCTASVLPIIL